MMEDVKNFAKAVAKHELTDPKEVAGLVSSRKKDKSKLKELESANRKAKSEIAKKDKVTAELTALLVLSKKAEAFLGARKADQRPGSPNSNRADRRGRIIRSSSCQSMSGTWHHRSHVSQLVQESGTRK